MEMTQSRLFARYGFKPAEKPGSRAAALLAATLRHLGPAAGRECVSEAAWVEALLLASQEAEWVGGERLVHPQEEELPLAEIDLHMRGIVRWMNELGIHTAHCCEGHGRRAPLVGLLEPPTLERRTLLDLSLPDGLRIVWHRRHFRLEARDEERLLPLLLDFAEQLHDLVQNRELLLRLEARMFKDRYVMGLLRVPGPSGREGPIRRVLQRRA